VFSCVCGRNVSKEAGMNASVNKDEPRKNKPREKKSFMTVDCIWQAAEWLGQYSRILDNLQTVTPGR